MNVKISPDPPEQTVFDFVRCKMGTFFVLAIAVPYVKRGVTFLPGEDPFVALSIQYNEPIASCSLKIKN
jgi:hypothetical protein